jgi:hypothetical protein
MAQIRSDRTAFNLRSSASSADWFQVILRQPFRKAAGVSKKYGSIDDENKPVG